MTTRTPNIPDLTDPSPSGIRSWARHIKMALGLLANDVQTTEKSALDVGVTFRDLINAGILKEAPPGTKEKFVRPGGEYLAPPPAPTNFLVTRLPYKVLLTWAEPTYPNHSHTEIWRATTNNLSQAQKIADWPVNIYEDVFQSGSNLFYWIRHVSEAGVVGGFNSINGTSDDSQPGDVTNLTYSFEGFAIRLDWNKVLDPDLDVYEIRHGASWDTATKVAEVKGTTFVWGIRPAGTYRLFVRARDVAGFYSGSASAIDVIIAAPGAPTVSSSILADSAVVTWTAVSGTFAIDYYEARLGMSFDTATSLGRLYTTTLTRRINWVGENRIWIRAVDVAGNAGPAANVSITVLAPGAPLNFRASVVDNNALLFWETNAGTLPIVTTRLYRGPTFATATLIGEKDGRFTSVFEQASGQYTYWAVFVDSAGNTSPAASVTATINQPPDYVLYSDLNLDLSGASLSNAVLQQGQILLPYNTTETWDAHYTSRSWNTDDDAINAGFPLYAQPTPTPGTATFTIDYGANVGATTVNVTPTAQVLAGSPIRSVQISWKLNAGDPWNDFPAGESAFIPSPFRYLKVVYSATNGGDQKAFVSLTNLNVKLSVKQKTLRRDGTWLTGSHASGGTRFLLTKDNTVVEPTGNVTNGQNTITSMSSLAGISVGMFVEGPGIPNNTYVTIVGTPANGVTLSQNATSSHSGATYTFGDPFFVDVIGPPIVQAAGSSARIPVVNFVDRPNPLFFRVYMFDSNGNEAPANVTVSWHAGGV